MMEMISSNNIEKHELVNIYIDNRRKDQRINNFEKIPREDLKNRYCIVIKVLMTAHTVH